MKRGDYKIIIIIFALVLGAYSYVIYKGMSTDDKMLTISQDQEVLYEFKIDDSYSNTIKIEQDDHYNVIYIRDGEAWVEEANCLNQVCVKHSHISKIGEMIVCIPHKLILEIKGDKNALDIIVD